jgi:hypothetical protein
MIVTAVMFLGATAFLPACYHRRESANWPATTGTVTRSELREWMRKPHIEPSFKPFVWYTYTVNGVTREGARIGLENEGEVPILKQAEAQAWLDENYPVGKRVVVYYDPANPDLAALIAGGDTLVMICQFVMGTLAICFLVALWQYRVAKQREPT